MNDNHSPTAPSASKGAGNESEKPAMAHCSKGRGLRLLRIPSSEGTVDGGGAPDLADQVERTREAGDSGLLSGKGRQGPNH